MVTKVKENRMTTTSELKPLLKRLRLGYLLNILPERLALARRDQLDYAAFLQILLADEVTRRDNRNLEIHLHAAGFEEVCRLEDFDWTAEITVDRRLLDAVFSLDFINRHEHVLLVGPVGNHNISRDLCVTVNSKAGYFDADSKGYSFGAGEFSTGNSYA